jgi:hypothetical protein
MYIFVETVYFYAEEHKKHQQRTRLSREDTAKYNRDIFTTRYPDRGKYARLYTDTYIERKYQLFFPRDIKSRTATGYVIEFRTESF